MAGQAWRRRARRPRSAVAARRVTCAIARLLMAAWPQSGACPTPSFEACAGSSLPADRRQERSARRQAIRLDRRCHYCGSAAHLIKSCTLGSSTHRSQQFLFCSEQCFARRYVVPLHHARTDFRLDSLREGRVDLAAACMQATLVCSQRLRHNAEIWLPFLGGASPTTVCVTGGLVRGLHPSEYENASRLRHAIDQLAEGLPDSHTPTPLLHPDLRGFRMMDGGFAEALTEALKRARQGGTGAPLLLLLQGAPPLQRVLSEYCQSAVQHGVSSALKTSRETSASTQPLLRDVVILLGDHVGLDSDEIELARLLGQTVGADGGGGAVLCASLGGGALLASHCIMICNHHLDALHDCPSQLWAPDLDYMHRKKKQSKRNKRRMNRKAPGTDWFGSTAGPAHCEEASEGSSASTGDYSD